MLERLSKVARRTVHATLLAGAATACYAGYEFYDGGRDRVAERYDAARARAADLTGTAWDRTKTYGEKTADRLTDDPTSLLLVVLPVLLTVLYYRMKGHGTGQAVLAAVTRTPLAAAPAGDVPEAVARARRAAELKDLQAYRAEQAKRAEALPKELSRAKSVLKAAAQTRLEAEEMLADAVKDESAAESLVVRLENELSRAVAEEDVLAARIEELKAQA